MVFSCCNSLCFCKRHKNRTFIIARRTGGENTADREQLIDYIAGTYGIDALARLLLGFAKYNDWEELAPAVFGVSAAALEVGWHTATREGAPLGTFH